MRASLSIFKEEKNLPYARIGNNCLIGANAVIYIGSSISNNVLIVDKILGNINL